MNKESFLLQVVAEQVEKEKLEEAEKQKSITKWLGPGNHLFLTWYMDTLRSKKSWKQFEEILDRAKSVKTNPG